MSTHVIIVYTELNALRTREAVCVLLDGREIFVNNHVNRYVAPINLITMCRVG